MDEENIFDEDEFVDYIIYEELEKEESKQKPTGCLTVFTLLMVPVSTLIIGFL